MNNKAKLWMYDNQYKQADNHPGKTGTGEIPTEALAAFVAHAKSSGTNMVKLRCASWERTSKQGNPYVFVTMEIDEKPKTTEAPKPEDLPW